MHAVTGLRAPCLACAGFLVLLAHRLVAGDVSPAGRLSVTAETNRPEMSLFIPGEVVRIRFTVGGMVAGDRDLALAVQVFDAHGREVQHGSFPIPVGHGPTWTMLFEAPASSLGYYRVRAGLSPAIVVAAQGNRAAGFLTYAVVPDPARRRSYPPGQLHFGMQGGWNTQVNAMPLLGVRWLNTAWNCRWLINEPDHAGQLAEMIATRRSPIARPAFDASYIGDDGKARRWDTYAIATSICDMPAWAKRDPAAKHLAALSAVGEAGFRDYCTALATANAPLYPDQPKHYYEIVWEPCIPWNFTGEIADVVRLFEIAYPAIHAADPRASIVGPCDSGINPECLPVLDAYLAKGLGRWIDAFSIHPYARQPCERNDLIATIRGIRARLRQVIGHDIPLIGTEMGYSHWSGAQDELEHAQRMTRQSLIMLGEGFLINYAFYFHDFGMPGGGGDGGYGYMHNLVDGGFNPGRVSPKPAAPAFAAMTWLLEGHASAGAIEWLGGTAWGYAYENADDIVLALWDSGGQPRTVSIPVGMAEVEVFDWMGNRELRPSKEGMLRLELGEDPVYVRGVARGLWSATANRAIACSTRLDAFPGGSVELTGTLNSPSQDRGFTGTLVLDPDPATGLRSQSQAVVIEAGRASGFGFHFAVPSSIAVGGYPLQLSLRDPAGQMLAAGRMRLEIAQPLSVSRVTPLLRADGDTGVAVELREAQGIVQRGTITARIGRLPEAASADFTLAAGASAIISMPHRASDIDPTAAYTAAIEIALANGYRYRQEAPLSFVGANRLDVPPRIDGDLAEWSALPAIALHGPDHVVRSPRFHAGNQALLRFGWDERALYLAVDVQDATFVQRNTGFDIWKGDCIQIGFNPEPGRNLAPSGNGLADRSLQPCVSKLCLALTSQGSQAYRHQSSVPERLAEGPVAAADLPLAVVVRDGHLLYEAAIPWRQLGCAAAPARLGFGLAINDLATAEQPDPSALGIFDVQDPARFGMLTLIEAR